LNEAVSLEYIAAIQYNQHSSLLTGQNKVLFEHLFQGSAQEALRHAKKWSDRIVYLGGVSKPAVNRMGLRQSSDVTEMLEMALDLEQRAVEIYSRAHKVCSHKPTLYMLENQIVDEDGCGTIPEAARTSRAGAETRGVTPNRDTPVHATERHRGYNKASPCVHDLQVLIRPCLQP
jgi:bacterioferritin